MHFGANYEVEINLLLRFTHTGKNYSSANAIPETLIFLIIDPPNYGAIDNKHTLKMFPAGINFRILKARAMIRLFLNQTVYLR